MDSVKTPSKFTWRACLLLILINYCLLFLPGENLLALTREDGLVENASALFLLLSSIAFSLAYLRSQDVRPNGSVGRNPFFLLLALFFFIAFGEEISWAQRILNIETPETLKNLNYQKEINLHNLEIFEGKNPDGSQKGGLAAIFTSHRIFYMLIVGWTLLIPLAYRFVSSLRNLLQRIRFPVHPLGIGILVVGILVLARMIKKLTDISSYDFDHAVTEIGELNIAVVVACLGYYWLSHPKQGKVVHTLKSI